MARPSQDILFLIELYSYGYTARQIGSSRRRLFSNTLDISSRKTRHHQPGRDYSPPGSNLSNSQVRQKNACSIF